MPSDTTEASLVQANQSQVRTAACSPGRKPHLVLNSIAGEVALELTASVINCPRSGYQHPATEDGGAHEDPPLP